MNILITGGNGFIASYLYENLKHEYNVLSLSKQQLNLLDDTSVKNFFQTYRIDVVIHCALSGRENLFDIDPKWFVDSMWMWRNLYNNRHLFNKLINFGTAYEFDLEKENHLATINNTLKCLPKSSYGYAKNMIARSCLETEKFYNLRLFGNFHYSENPQRFFKKLLTLQNFQIYQDRLFDYFHLEDIILPVKTIINENVVHKDINLVYREKYKISELVDIFCSINKIKPNIEIIKSAPSLTGDSDILNSFHLPLKGLEYGFSLYT